MDSDMARIDRIVIVPHNCALNQNGWLKYDHWLMYKKYTGPLPYYGMRGNRKTSWDGPANKKTVVKQHPLNNSSSLGSGCGATGRAVSSVYGDLQFEYCHWQFNLLSTVTKLYRTNENKEKEAENGPIKKQ